jgi:hypothetical protein
LQDAEFRRGLNMPFKATTREQVNKLFSQSLSSPGPTKYTPNYVQVDPTQHCVVIREKKINEGTQRKQEQRKQ